MQVEKVEKESRWLVLKGFFKRMPRWSRWVTVISIVLLLVSGVSVSIAMDKAVNVNVARIIKEDIERTVFTNGRLEAVNEQHFFTPVDSTLMELHVKLGDRVKKGDILGRLDTLELGRRYQNAVAVLAGKEAQLARSEAVDDKLAFAQAELEFNNAQNRNARIEKLSTAGAVSQEEAESSRLVLAKAETDYQEALVKVQKGAGSKEKQSLQAQVNLAGQEVAQARERLNMATFVAEVDGVVTFVGAKKGNQVMEGTELLTISDDSRLKVTADINEIDAGSLELGQEVKIRCLALVGKEFCGEVKRIGDAAVMQQSSAGEMVNVPVTINLEGDTNELKIGYTVDLSIKTMERLDVLTVPVEAVFERDGRKMVYVVNKGLIEEREISCARGNELNDIILSGLELGDEVIINPSSALHNGQNVTAIPQEEKKK